MKMVVEDLTAEIYLFLMQLGLGQVFTSDLRPQGFATCLKLKATAWQSEQFGTVMASEPVC